MKIKAYLAVAALCIIWGTSYMFVKFGVLAFPPLQFAGMRQTIAGVVLLGLFFGTQHGRLPSRKYLQKQMIYGVLMIGCGNGLITWAVQFVPTGITALLGSAVPIIVVVINHLTGSAEKVNRKVAFGIVLGFIGPVIIFSDHLHEFLNLKYALGILFILLGGIAWSWGSILSKEYNLPYNSMMNAGFQMLFGGGAMLIGSLLIEKPSFAHADLRSLISLAYLVLVASAFAFTIYHFAMKHLPVTIVSLYTYVNPLVAIVLGWMFLGERLTWNILVAFVVIVAGIYLVNIGFQRNPKSVITRYLRKQR